MTTLNEVSGADGHTVRVAVEGCGHGTLDAIYSSIQNACEAKGWDSVDLLIIGGDFQAVRDRYDLNVTAMPAKYRKMADFHHYYWGTKQAPYLTIFIGGNHEASNHLFELYYGGWAAPNIYYLGAANVIQVGPLTIAGMSGIWKGYDYRKPHYERLPYNDEDISSIYHVRELDVRKLLAFRSQIDIGLSHDWPQGVEWLGDHAQLFRYKPNLEEDARSGRLGSVAAKQVMEHLRPVYWFSAHLHTRYTALKIHDTPTETVAAHEAHASSIPTRVNVSVQPTAQKISAWNNFGTRAKIDEAAEDARIVQEQKERREEFQRNGKPISSGIEYQETYKKVKLGDGLGRVLDNVSQVDQNGADEVTSAAPPQLDGCGASVPVKRRRESSTSHHDMLNDEVHQPGYIATLPPDSGQHAISATSVAAATNPDAIDVDSSDDDSNSGFHDDLGNKLDQEMVPLMQDKEGRGQTQPRKGDDKAIFRDNHSVIALSLPATESHSESVSDASVSHEAGKDVIQPTPLDSNRLQAETSLKSAKSLSNPTNGQPTANTNGNSSTEQDNDTTTVSESMRAQLAALSNTFADSVKLEVSPALPHPEAIRNKETKFLALSKCEAGQLFLQLLEVDSISKPTEPVKQPIKIRYVPEWLAILRTFAPELSLGSNAKTPTPHHRGDTYYRERIIEEEKWVDQNITKLGRLDVPENFTVTVSKSDNNVPLEAGKMPREVTNPQTTAFCKLLGIENHFDISEETRDARMAAGPGESSNRSSFTGRGSRGNSGPRYRGGGGGRGGRGRGGGGRGRSRGRGRGT